MFLRLRRGDPVDRPRHLMDLPKRKTVRLKHFDYSSNTVYFITLCSLNRECIFGDIKEGVFNPSPIGEIVWAEWRRTPEVRHEILLDVFCLMPNHFHALVSQRGDSAGRATHRVAPTKSKTLKPKTVGSLVGQFKSMVSKRAGRSVWQRNYYEHIIRNDADLDAPVDIFPKMS